MSGSSASLTFAQPYAEVGLSREYVLAKGALLTPDVRGGYRYDGGAQGQDVTLTASDGTVFTGNRVGCDRN